MQLENFTEIKRKRWSLAYAPEFEQYRDKYENIVSKIKGVIEGEKVEGVEIKKIGEYADREYFKLTEGDGEFFIKKTANYNQGGMDEFKAGQEVEEKITAAGLVGVKSIHYIFAYSDEKNKYAVSRYEKDAENILYYYIAKEKIAMNYAKVTELEKRVEEIQEGLPEYEDLRSRNMGYNPETDEIVLFDLNLKKDTLVISSDEEL